jgi:hypothetical protein
MWLKVFLVLYTFLKLNRILTYKKGGKKDFMPTINDPAKLIFKSWSFLL